jgi:hypothetical protein
MPDQHPATEHRVPLAPHDHQLLVNKHPLVPRRLVPRPLVHHALVIPRVRQPKEVPKLVPHHDLRADLRNDDPTLVSVAALAPVNAADLLPSNIDIIELPNQEHVDDPTAEAGPADLVALLASSDVRELGPDRVDSDDLKANVRSLEQPVRMLELLRHPLNRLHRPIGPDHHVQVDAHTAAPALGAGRGSIDVAGQRGLDGGVGHGWTQRHAYQYRQGGEQAEHGASIHADAPAIAYHAQRMVDDDDVLDTIPEDEPVLPEPPLVVDHDPEPRAETSFCPECGTENSASAASCQRCGRVLDPLATVIREGGPARKLRGEVVATVAGISAALVVLAWLVSFSLQLTSRTVLRIEGERMVETQVLFSAAGLGEVFGVALAFGVAGLVAALWFAGRYLQEVVLGATAGMMVQFLLWLYMARAAGASLRGDLWVVGEGFVMRGPAPILFTQLLLLMLFTALLFAFAGWIIREQVSGNATCVRCHQSYLLHPTPPVRCPKCDAEQDRDGVQWPWVMAVALVTSILFALIVVLLREPLGFALECRGSNISEACMKARGNDDYTIFVTSLSRNEFTFWAIDQVRYLEVTAALMLLSPLVLTFLVKRGSRASAGALVPINWLAASFVVMIVLADLGGSESGFIFLMRMQVLALFMWTLAGVVGVLIGDKLRFRKGSAYLDEIADE